MSDDVSDVNDILKNKKIMTIDEAREYQAQLKRKVEQVRQDIDNATDESTSDHWLDYMNKNYAFIESIGGKPFIKSYVYNETFNREVLEFRTPDAIATVYSNQKVTTYKRNGTLDVIPVGKWWIEHPHRLQYSTVIFDPSQDKEVIAGNSKLYNLWEGLTVTPAKGVWRKTLKHIYTILCNAERKKFLYFIKWLAWMFQNPDKRAEVAVIFKGKQGAGKGFIWEQVVSIFGIHAMNVSSADHFSGKFNSHFRSLVFLFADEAYYPGDKEAEGRIKELITSPRIATEAKFKDTVLSVNRLHIGMATNNDFVIPSEDESVRRYFINKVDDKYAFNQKLPAKIRERYFTELWGEMENGGRAAMVYDLLRIQLGRWHPRNDIPNTDELKRQKLRGIRNEFRAVATFLEEGEFPGTKYHYDNTFYSVNINTLIAKMKTQEIGIDKVPIRRITEVLKSLGAYKKHNKDGNMWIMPELDLMRQRWNSMYIQIEFDELDKWTTMKPEY